jgi:hypothetical protein
VTLAHYNPGQRARSARDNRKGSFPCLSVVSWEDLSESNRELVGTSEWTLSSPRCLRFHDPELSLRGERLGEEAWIRTKFACENRRVDPYESEERHWVLLGTGFIDRVGAMPFFLIHHV